jgi:hypothetical protein
LFEAFAWADLDAVIVLRRNNRRSNAEVLMIEASAWLVTPNFVHPWTHRRRQGWAWAVARSPAKNAKCCA